MSLDRLPRHSDACLFGMLLTGNEKQVRDPEQYPIADGCTQRIKERKKKRNESTCNVPHWQVSLSVVSFKGIAPPHTGK